MRAMEWSIDGSPAASQQQPWGALNSRSKVRWSRATERDSLCLARCESWFLIFPPPPPAPSRPLPPPTDSIKTKSCPAACSCDFQLPESSCLLPSYLHKLLNFLAGEIPSRFKFFFWFFLGPIVRGGWVRDHSL
jgi:hypothetical protein